MTDIVDCCRVWERHCEVEIQPRTSADRRPVRVICQVTEVEPSPATSPETETVEDIIRKLLPTPAPLPPHAVPIPSDWDLLIQKLMEAICPPTPVAQEQSPATDLETLLLNWLPVGTVTEEDAYMQKNMTVQYNRSTYGRSGRLRRRLIHVVRLIIVTELAICYLPQGHINHQYTINIRSLYRIRYIQ